MRSCMGETRSSCFLVILTDESDAATHAVRPAPCDRFHPVICTSCLRLLMRWHGSEPALVCVSYQGESPPIFLLALFFSLLFPHRLVKYLNIRWTKNDSCCKAQSQRKSTEHWNLSWIINSGRVVICFDFALLSSYCCYRHGTLRQKLDICRTLLPG